MISYVSLSEATLDFALPRPQLRRPHNTVRLLIEHFPPPRLLSETDILPCLNGEIPAPKLPRPSFGLIWHPLHRLFAPTQGKRTLPASRHSTNELPLDSASATAAVSL